jgi:hypothetical protein
MARRRASPTPRTRVRMVYVCAGSVWLFRVWRVRRQYSPLESAAPLSPAHPLLITGRQVRLRFNARAARADTASAVGSPPSPAPTAGTAVASPAAPPSQRHSHVLSCASRAAEPHPNTAWHRPSLASHTPPLGGSEWAVTGTSRPAPPSPGTRTAHPDTRGHRQAGTRTHTGHITAHHVLPLGAPTASAWAEEWMCPSSMTRSLAAHHTHTHTP